MTAIVRSRKNFLLPKGKISISISHEDMKSQAPKQLSYAKNGCSKIEFSVRPCTGLLSLCNRPSASELIP